MPEKKQRLFNKARRSGLTRDRNDFKAHTKATLKALNKAHWSYINGILQEGLVNNDNKPFWSYVKAKKQDNVGVSPLKQHGVLRNDPEDRAEILSNQFRSVFT